MTLRMQWSQDSGVAHWHRPNLLYLESRTVVLFKAKAKAETQEEGGASSAGDDMEATWDTVLRQAIELK